MCQVSPSTQKIVDDLLDIPVQRGDGSGIMVLIRVSPDAGVAHGILMKKKLVHAQKSLGLNDRFAVILDVQQHGASFSSDIGDPMLKRMHEWNRHGDASKFAEISPTSYEHLLDLPVILILCEKGKMGDTFPKSLRHYDLRLRYSGI